MRAWARIGNTSAGCHFRVVEAADGHGDGSGRSSRASALSAALIAPSGVAALPQRVRAGLSAGQTSQSQPPPGTASTHR